MKEILLRLRNTTIKTFYKHITKPILFQQDPEEVHERFMRIGTMLGKNAAGTWMTKIAFSYNHPMLQQTITGIEFPNPVGLAAGFDKNATLSELLPALGFGFAELGSITGEPCTGNPKPRLWRLPESQSIIVYYGLKNNGADAIAAQLADKTFAIPIGISAAKTNCTKTVLLSAGIEDYCHVLEKFRTIGAYYTINISCPNSYGGLDFSASERLEKLFLEMRKRKLFCKPVFLKLSPDLSLEHLDALIALSLKYNIAGLVCSNLVKKKENAALHIAEKEKWIYGGVSGRPVYAHALKHVGHIYKKTKGKLIVVGCGGIFSAEDAYAYIKNGASLVQLITGMIYEGPQLVSSINIGLVELLRKDGFKHISEAVGKNF
jgi:dihydroorotate dehydrogenase